MTIKIFTTVGVTPLAVANALASHIKRLPTTDSVECFFLIGSAPGESFPNRTSSNIRDVVSAFQQNRQNIPALKKHPITLHSEDHIIDIYEQDLAENVVMIVKQTRGFLQPGDRIIFEITGGRKTMTGSALIAASILQQKFPQTSFEIGYYWLKEFTPEYTDRLLFELGFDAYESIIFSLQSIDERLQEALL